MIKQYDFDGYIAYEISSENVVLNVTALGATSLKMTYKGHDVILGYDKASYYEDNDHKLGAVIGRVANRIAGASFDINGKTYKLPINEQDYCTHGGPLSFDSKVYDSIIIGNADLKDGGTVKFTRISPDKENGFPGNLTFSVIYEVKNDEVSVKFEGVSDEDTYLAPTLHNYFGPVDDSRNIKMWLNSDKVLEMEQPRNIPTGKVFDTSLENYKVFNYSEIKEVGIQLDNCFPLNDGSHAVKLIYPDGMTVDIYSDMPAVQVYTGHALKKPHHYWEGLAVEPGFAPDSMHHSNFPSVLLKKNEKFSKYIKYVLSK